MAKLWRRRVSGFIAALVVGALAVGVVATAEAATPEAATPEAPVVRAVARPAAKPTCLSASPAAGAVWSPGLPRPAA